MYAEPIFFSGTLPLNLHLQINVERNMRGARAKKTTGKNKSSSILATFRCWVNGSKPPIVVMNSPDSIGIV
jgi:hypothetical protein